jgi:subtilisin family serine protease
MGGSRDPKPSTSEEIVMVHRPIVCAALVLAARAAVAAFPATAPNDPLYPPDTCPPASTCAGPTGQWNLFSTDAHFPPTLHASGISADLAWQVTTGRPDVVIAILDSGVDYDHEDLRNKIWLNRGELPVPLGACTPPPGDPHDCNADGVFDVRDYATDPRVTDGNGSGAVDRGDLRTFADGVDDDGNGYVDDLSGFDTDDDDGDEFDDRYFGHGTGRAGIAAPETDNGLGVAGVCPDCPLMNVRIDDTFVHSSEGVAKGAIYAIDNGASVINMSLGGTTASRLSRGAFVYATRKDVVAVNASANEFSFHQNFQSVFDDVMTIGGITPNSTALTTTWLQKANFSNYGAHLDVVAPTVMPGAAMGHAGALPDHADYTESANGTSSSTPHAAGVAALVFSRARDLGLTLSAQEVRQIINRTARDITPADGTTYPVSVGWDKWTGYGRIDARAAVDRVAPTTIPPEADIDAPDWYTLVDGTVTVRFYANARRAGTFSYTLEVGGGVEPASFAPLAGAAGVPANAALSSADQIDNFSASWSTTALADGLYTLRLRVTDNLGNAGEDRMAVWVRHPDAHDQPGFPRRFDGSLESLSVALVDLDGDNRLEIVFVDGNGEVHAVRADGSDLPGFPVHTDLPGNLPLATSDAFDGNPANGEVALSYASLVGGPAVADLDRDGRQEVVVGALDGKLYCWHGDATPCAGFPVSTDFGTSRDPYGTHAQIPNTAHGEAIAATPALGDLDGDGRLEIVAGAADQKLYVWHHDGSRMAPFPLQIFDASSASGVDEFAPRAILSSAAIADLDADGANEIAVGTNETYATPAPPGTGGSGRAYLIEANGTLHAGWPVKPTSISPSAVPLVAEGVGTSPVVADLDGNGTKEIALTAFIGDPTIYRVDGTTFATMQGAPFGATGPGSDLDETTPEGGLARASDTPSHFYVANGAFADVDGDAVLDYLAGAVGNGLLAIATGAGTPAVFDHLLAAWNATTGVQKPAFPRVLEDWQFLIGPAVAEISGDALPEIVASSGGFFVHAFNAAGLEPAGWPKLTGQWQTATPSIGDLDGDGDVELVQPTRLGTLFVWSTEGATCQADQWRKFRHDEWNSGAYGADTRRPARITDFAAAPDAGSVRLSWTAPGDDGACGTAATYELRASSAPITPASFAGATAIAIGPPGAAGTAEVRSVSPPSGATFFALRAVDEAGNAAPLATASAVGGWSLRSVRLTLAGAGQDRLQLKGSIGAVLGTLGLPGTDVTLALADAGGEYFRATVPAARLVANRTGTKVRFRDASGTVAGGVVSLAMGGRTRTDLSVRARGLTLGGASPGPFTATLVVNAPLSASGTLRAVGSRLLHP